MSADLILANLQSWFVQVLLLVAACGILPFAVRLRAAAPRLLYWQIVLAVCCALPLIQRWHQEVVRIAPAPVRSITSTAPASAATSSYSIDWTGIAVWVLATGVLARLLWTGAGLLRLRRIRRSAEPFEPIPENIVNLKERLGVTAQTCISDRVSGPVTFGWLAPIVLLPPVWREMPPAAQEAVVCHELLHVRRQDWMFTLLEELAAALLWFHPAIWWLLGRIRLTREQAVDHEVVLLTGGREEYVEALVTVAKSGSGLDLRPATLFLRRRHLVLRIGSLIQEATMSRRHKIGSVAAGMLALLLVAWFAVRTFPLQAAPQVEITRPSADQNVTADTGTLKLLHRPPLRYPAEARAKRVQGTVTLELSIDSNGGVTDARVLSGPEELRKAALQSVLEWHYSKQGTPAKQTVNLNYEAPSQTPQPPTGVMTRMSVVTGAGTPADAANRTLTKIEYRVPDAVREEIEPALREFIGQELNNDLMQRIAAKATEAEPHVMITWRRNDIIVTLRDDVRSFVSSGGVAGGVVGGVPGGVRGGVAGGGAPGGENAPRQIRVGAGVQATKLIEPVQPEYPPLARQARIQGVVRLQIIVDESGHVRNTEVVSGHPLLVPAALNAVRQYVYRQTLLNGNPVEVVTTVDVNFTLPEA